MQKNFAYAILLGGAIKFNKIHSHMPSKRQPFSLEKRWSYLASTEPMSDETTPVRFPPTTYVLEIFGYFTSVSFGIDKYPGFKNIVCLYFCSHEIRLQTVVSSWHNALSSRFVYT